MSDDKEGGEEEKEEKEEEKREEEEEEEEQNMWASVTHLSQLEEPLVPPELWHAF